MNYDVYSPTRACFNDPPINESILFHQVFMPKQTLTTFYTQRGQINANPSWYRHYTCVYRIFAHSLWLFDHHATIAPWVYEYLTRYSASLFGKKDFAPKVAFWFFRLLLPLLAVLLLPFRFLSTRISMKSEVSLLLLCVVAPYASLYTAYFPAFFFFSLFLNSNSCGHLRSYHPIWCTCWSIIDGELVHYKWHRFHLVLWVEDSNGPLTVRHTHTRTTTTTNHWGALT